jgi:hypothetical protein
VFSRRKSPPRELAAAPEPAPAPPAKAPASAGRYDIIPVY